MYELSWIVGCYWRKHHADYEMPTKKGAKKYWRLYHDYCKTSKQNS